ncbi:class I SAM-dependent methyltransferase [Candidatus Saccharibacteria bacterium]|nr:class I SAM-dependent methyltransferase [Candidatus Saccharibacteria bacterium]
MSNYSDSQYAENPNSSWYKILHLVEPGSRVLDIGCSSGNFGEELINGKQCIVDGIELDHGDAREARKKLRNVYELNIETDPLDEIKDKYDYIYFGDVIEHLVDPSQALKRLKPLFQNEKKAKILFSLPNMSHISVRLMLLNGNFEYGRTGLLDNTHLHFYTLHELNRVFNRAGMEIGHFDPVIKDYPAPLLDKELSTVGLSNTKEFTDFVNSTNASVYQLVGYAEYTTKPKKVPMEVSSPRDSFATLLQETNDYYGRRLKDSERHIKKLEKHVNEQQDVINNQQNVINEQQKRLNKSLKNIHKRAYRKLKKSVRR